MHPLTVVGVVWSLLTFQTSVGICNKLERLSLSLINCVFWDVLFVRNLFFMNRRMSSSVEQTLPFVILTRYLNIKFVRIRAGLTNSWCNCLVCFFVLLQPTPISQKISKFYFVKHEVTLVQGPRSLP